MLYRVQYSRVRKRKQGMDGVGAVAAVQRHLLRQLHPSLHERIERISLSYTPVQTFEAVPTIPRFLRVHALPCKESY
jgi:hypothetical protein